MTIAVGDKIPDATLVRMTDEGPETVSLADKLAGRKVVVFALPGAFTPTCSSAHVPSFMRVMKPLADKGVDEVICISVNDPHVMRQWGEITGATEAGITMLADVDAGFTKSVGMNFSAPVVGFFDRSIRYAMLVEDGVVRIYHPEEGRGVCETSSGEAMLAAMD